VLDHGGMGGGNKIEVNGLDGMHDEFSLLLGEEQGYHAGALCEERERDALGLAVSHPFRQEARKGTRTQRAAMSALPVVAKGDEGRRSGKYSQAQRSKVLKEEHERYEPIPETVGDHSRYQAFSPKRGDCQHKPNQHNRHKS
jgi:hypothetical protein